jgi:hypothetical protein
VVERGSLPGVDAVVGEGARGAGGGGCGELPGGGGRRGSVGGLAWGIRAPGEQAGDESGEAEGGQGYEAAGGAGGGRDRHERSSDGVNGMEEAYLDVLREAIPRYLGRSPPICGDFLFILCIGEGIWEL